MTRPEHKYILQDGKPVPEPDVLKWGQWFENSNEERIVAQTSVKGCRVSTVFLGLNHQFREGPPILYETIVFGGRFNEECVRYSTLEEAGEGHKKIIELVELADKPVWMQFLAKLNRLAKFSFLGNDRQ